MTHRAAAGWCAAVLAAVGLYAQEPPPKRPLPFAWRGERMEETYTGDRLLQSPERLVLERGAIEADGILLLADRITYIPATEELEALGNIRLEGPGVRLRCGRLRMHWGQRAGEAFALELEVDPDWTLRSDKVVFHTLRHWAFDAVEVNACPQESPGWTARISSLKLDLDGFATLHNALIYLGKVPTPYFLPWAIFPAKAQRSSGLLPPSIGRSSRYGMAFGPTWFQTLGDRADVTASPEFFSRQRPLWGGELRWHPDPTHQGSVTGQLIHEREEPQRRRYRFQVKELWQREDGWTLAADVNQASDTLLDADYGRGTGGLGTTSFDSSIYAGRNFSFASLSLSASEQRSFFLPEDPLFQPGFPTNFRRKTSPSVQLRFYPVEIGNFYVDGGARVGRLSYVLQLGDDQPSGYYYWGRDDVYSRVQGRLGQLGPVRADLQVMARYTRYGASLRDPFFNTQDGLSGFQESLQEQALSPFTVDGPQLVRRMLSSRLQFSGPQVGRVFERFSLLGYKGEVKHVLEPYVGLTANSGFNKADRVPRFDEVDARPGVLGSAMGEQSVEVGFRQHLLGRAGKGLVFADLVRWRTSMRFHVKPVLQPDGRTQKKGWGSLDNELDFEPDDTVRISFRRSSEVGESSADTALSMDFKLPDQDRITVAAFSTGLNRFLVRQRGIQVGGLHRIWSDRVRFEYSANYAFSRQTPAGHRNAGFVSSQVGLTWVTPCVATILRYSHVALDDPFRRGMDDRLDLSLNLRGLGDLFKYRW